MKAVLGVNLRTMCEIAIIVITLAGLLYLVEAADDVNKFRRCYNTSMDTHCFDVQYDTINNRWLYTSFDDARTRCNNLSSTLLIIKDEDTNNILQRFMTEAYNPISQQFVWIDAYRVNDFNNTYTWHWVDSTLPTLNASDVTFLNDPGWYVVSLEFRDKSFYLTAKQPYNQFNYICEYAASNCSSISSNNMRQFDGRCYDAINELVNWYEARNKCLKRGGDLASFANVTSINFTSWLEAKSYNRYWIGLRFTWYIWIDTGEKVRYSKWVTNGYERNTPCLGVWFNSNPTFNWFPKENTSVNVYVVCHTVTSINPTTTSTTTTTTSTTTTMATTSNSDTPFNEHSVGRKPDAVAIGVGVGVGVGVPILIAVIVLVICIIVRKRRHETASSAQSTNRHQKESSIDQPYEAPTGNERDEIGETAYGTVVPSMLSRQAAEANGANSATEQTVYAPLQIL